MKSLDNNNGLSRKETEVLIALSKGNLYKEIAAEQGITINTVKKHCKNIYKKLEVRNRTEAANIFLRDKTA
ncbi:MAG: LuxR C-terminal-related transcriptional regulator [Ferruginibacter sp.]